MGSRWDIIALGMTDVCRGRGLGLFTMFGLFGGEGMLSAWRTGWFLVVGLWLTISFEGDCCYITSVLP